VICPHCSHDIPLTWGKYFRSTFKAHVCPGCGKKFKVTLTVSSIALILGASIVAAGMPAVIAFFFVHNFWYTIAAYVVFVFAVVIPFDRWLDDKVRPAKPVH
jgi:hypothetical protein